jgi:hypothetical protein
MHSNARIDTPIYTSDGSEIGKVGEIRGKMLKVNAAMQPDYWLDCETVMSTDMDGVRLNFEKDRLEHYKSEFVTP